MSLLGLMNQSITIYSKSGYDEWGARTFGTGVATNCRFQETTERKMNPDGSVVVIMAIAYVPPATTVETDFRIDYGAKKFKVYGKYPAIDGTGQTNHIKLELVEWQET